MRIIIVILIAAFAVLGVIVALQPDTFRVARSMTMSAAPPVVFAQVDDLRNWEAWNPWQKKDPAMKLAYSGPQTGPGASYSWAGNKDVGEGSLTIKESRPNDLVRMELQFTKPFRATNIATFTFAPAGNQTNVTWIMEGRNNFFSKAFQLVMNMDKMIGDDFEKGLANMKAVVEAAPKQ